MTGMAQQGKVATVENSKLRETIERLLELGEVAQSAGMESGAEPVLRFGDVAVALGFCSRTQVWLALETQRLDREDGRPHRLVGQIMQEKGWLTAEQCAQIVDALAQVVAVRRCDAQAPLVGRLSA